MRCVPKSIYYPHLDSDYIKKESVVLKTYFRIRALTKPRQ